MIQERYNFVSDAFSVSTKGLVYHIFIESNKPGVSYIFAFAGKTPVTLIMFPGQQLQSILCF
jgi:hypothetical protein